MADRLGIGEEVRKKGRTAGGGKVSMELMAKSTVDAIGKEREDASEHGEKHQHGEEVDDLEGLVGDHGRSIEVRTELPHSVHDPS